MGWLVWEGVEGAKHSTVAGAIALLALGGGFLWGRYTAPTRTVEKTQVVEKRIEDTESKVKVRELLAQLETMKRHTRREETVLPDGTRTIVTDTHVDRTRDTRSDVATQTEEKRHTEAVRTVEVIREVERARPDWRAGAVLLFDGAPLYGAQVQRRILGPVSLGALGATDTRGRWLAGASLSVEW